jgi:membrane associated rhomboid family serine protease
MFPIRDNQRSYTTPVVVVLLIVCNVLAFLYELWLDPYSQNYFIAQWGMTPARFQAVDMLTSMFLHGGWMHLIGNMWFLWVFGDNIEDVLGHGRFLLFYLLCGVIAAAAHLVFNPDSRVPTVGASGAIAGVMGAYMVKFPKNTIVTLVPIFFFVTFVDVPALVMLGYWFVLQLVSGVGTVGYSHLSQGGVAWFAHIGGFVAGIVLVKLMETNPRYSRRRDIYW